MTGALIKNPSAFEAGLEAAFAVRRGDAPAPRVAAFDRFARHALPGRRLEGWRWSDFKTALRQSSPAPKPTSDAVTPPSDFASLAPLEIHIVNGRIALPEGEMPDGLRVGIVDAMATIQQLEDHPMASLNVAMTSKAFGFEVADGVTLERPILIRHIVDGGGFAFAQSVFRVCEGACAILIESFEGDGAGLYSHLCHGDLRDGARLKRYVLNDTGSASVVQSLAAVKIDGQARLDQTSLSTGAALVRHETHTHFLGEDAEATINSAALLKGDAHTDFTTNVLHKAANCKVRQLHKGVGADKARVVFQGKFEVERTAQKTDAKMTANAMLLNPGAEANHKPELEIYADDVECAHGSTVGALDDDALFYLRQRGLPERDARALLIEAFAGEVVEAIDDEEIRAIYARRLGNWLEAQS